MHRFISLDEWCAATQSLFVLEILSLLLIGVAAGAVTTVAGFGGGLFVTLVLSLVWDPHTALGVAAAALLVGNAHRLWKLRRVIDRDATPSIVVGAVLGGAIGGWVTAGLEATTIRWLLVAVTGLAVARALGWLRLPRSRAVLFPGGFGVGFIAATTGGGGLLLAPLLLAVGLTDVAFLATGTATAVAVHVGRIGSYVSTGLLRPEHATMAVVLAAGLVIGNASGFIMRGWLSAATRERSTWVVLVIGIVLALAGVT